MRLPNDLRYRLHAERRAWTFTNLPPIGALIKTTTDHGNQSAVSLPL